ncbi:hypothetical protein O0L34_g18476 [Tuta absoluta]|nr:hypothetical protein O0L34_g18476 [Tuta absoluta]
MAQKREDQVESRRVFGGAVASLNEFPAVAALLDRYWITRCSASVIKPYWALTAAHCVTSHVAYVRYNTGNPSSSAGNTAHALYLYRHPNFKVKQEDEGEGMDITVLHHDLGLIRTRDRMILRTPMSPLKSMGQYKPDELRRYEVTVLGYGKTNDAQKAGENLYAVKLRMDSCYRDSWLHCFCGNAIGQEQRGVCSGDSGGPVVYKRVQVGVTSMGPVECVSIRSDLPEEASSVFTSTYHYQNLIQRTINNAEKEIEIKRARMSGDDSKTATESISLVIISVLAIILL